MDLNLFQKELAERLGANKDTVRFWENSQARPSLAKIPKIIEFLGYDPLEKKTEILGERIREFRRVHGLSRGKFAEQLGVDQTTLAGWESGEHRPSKKMLKEVILLLGSDSEA
jgi:transcriptional regulator with XRE-family HTH domain